MTSVLKDKSDQTFTVLIVQKMATFFSMSFARNIRAFQFACHELQPEVTDFISLVVQTPLIPISSIAAISFDDCSYQEQYSPRRM
jgi:hypothetical protein